MIKQKIIYFAYGSNMHLPRLEARVGSVKCLGTYTLKEFKLVFDCGNGTCNFANIIYDENSKVEGVLYELTTSQLLKLDFFEGLYKRYSFVDFIKGKRKKIAVYVSSHRRRELLYGVTQEYYDALYKGAINNNLFDLAEQLKQKLQNNIVSPFFEHYYYNW